MVIPLTPAEAAEVERHLPLVRWVVRRVPAYCREDALQDGVLGLMRAVQRFDPGRGVTFSTYATKWILGAVRSGLTRSDTNRRRADRLGVVYVPPVSLDAVRSDVDDRALVDDLAADVDVEGLVVEQEAVEQFARGVTRSPVLRRTIVALAAGDRACDIARAEGISGQAVRHRVKTIRRSVKEATDA